MTDDSAPEDSASEDNGSEDSASEDKGSEGAAPENSAPEDGAPDDSGPEDGPEPSDAAALWAPASPGPLPVAAPVALPVAVPAPFSDAVDALRRARETSAEELRVARQRRWSARLAPPQPRWCDFDRPFRLADFYEGAAARRASRRDV